MFELASYLWFLNKKSFLRILIVYLSTIRITVCVLTRIKLFIKPFVWTKSCVKANEMNKNQIEIVRFLRIKQFPVDESTYQRFFAQS